MNNTQLNPDARRAAFEAVQAIDGPASIGSMEIVDAAVSAYLAVAKPEVNSVEELDKLPVGTVLRDRIGWIWEIQDVGEFITTGSEYDSYSQEVNRPARVLYRPTRESTNGR